MISIHQDIISSVIQDNKVDIDKIINDRKKLVVAFQQHPTKSGGRGKPRKAISMTNALRKYLNLLVDNFEEIVLANPNEIISKKKEFDAIISGEDLAKNHKDFKDRLINRMGYETLRSSLFPKHFLKTGIKACIYCNSQLAITVDTIKKKKSARFQVDHFLPKSEYPCFSISFFNLLPSCGPCNGKKSATNIHFNVYSKELKDLQQSPFTFELDKQSLVSYRLDGNPEKLKIKLLDPQNIEFNKYFDIEGIYNMQKDLAEELVLKSMIYNKQYLKSLKESFKQLYPNKMPMVERLLVGNYTKEEDIHKRPMAKFTQDIAKQLKLIK